MTRGPNGGRPGTTVELGVFNLDDAQAKLEAEAKPFPFTFRGHHYEMRNPGLVPWNLQAKLDAATETQDTAAVEALMREMLGGDLYDQLTAAGANRFTLEALMAAANEAAGMGDTPNSSPPSRPASTPK